MLFCAVCEHCLVLVRTTLFCVQRLRATCDEILAPANYIPNILSPGWRDLMWGCTLAREIATAILVSDGVRHDPNPFRRRHLFEPYLPRLYAENGGQAQPAEYVSEMLGVTSESPLDAPFLDVVRTAAALVRFSGVDCAVTLQALLRVPRFADRLAATPGASDALFGTAVVLASGGGTLVQLLRQEPVPSVAGLSGMICTSMVRALSSTGNPDALVAFMALQNGRDALAALLLGGVADAAAAKVNSRMPPKVIVELVRGGSGLWLPETLVAWVQHYATQRMRARDGGPRAIDDVAEVLEAIPSVPGGTDVDKSALALQVLRVLYAAAAGARDAVDHRAAMLIPARAVLLRLLALPLMCTAFSSVTREHAVASAAGTLPEGGAVAAHITEIGTVDWLVADSPILAGTEDESVRGSGGRLEEALRPAYVAFAEAVGARLVGGVGDMRVSARAAMSVLCSAVRPARLSVVADVVVCGWLKHVLALLPATDLSLPDELLRLQEVTSRLTVSSRLRPILDQLSARATVVIDSIRDNTGTLTRSFLVELQNKVRRSGGAYLSSITSMFRAFRGRDPELSAETISRMLGELDSLAAKYATLCGSVTLLQEYRAIPAGMPPSATVPLAANDDGIGRETRATLAARVDQLVRGIGLGPPAPQSDATEAVRVVRARAVLALQRLAGGFLFNEVLRKQLEDARDTAASRLAEIVNSSADFLRNVVCSEHMTVRTMGSQIGVDLADLITRRRADALAAEFATLYEYFSAEAAEVRPGVAAGGGGGGGSGGGGGGGAGGGKGGGGGGGGPGPLDRFRERLADLSAVAAVLDYSAALPHVATAMAEISGMTREATDDLQSIITELQADIPLASARTLLAWVTAMLGAVMTPAEKQAIIVDLQTMPSASPADIARLYALLNKVPVAKAGTPARAGLTSSECRVLAEMSGCTTIKRFLGSYPTATAFTADWHLAAARATTDEQGQDILNKLPAIFRLLEPLLRSPATIVALAGSVRAVVGAAATADDIVRDLHFVKQRWARGEMFFHEGAQYRRGCHRVC